MTTIDKYGEELLADLRAAVIAYKEALKVIINTQNEFSDRPIRIVS